MEETVVALDVVLLLVVAGVLAQRPEEELIPARLGRTLPPPPSTGTAAAAIATATIPRGSLVRLAASGFRRDGGPQSHGGGVQGRGRHLHENCRW